MALFDLNSRYTKSMEHGGSYERDASIGGYNRKELRGLNKQAKRGTLTQRERARLKYLTDERKGRRKRGLLSGLGGAAATLGALAAAGKLGEGEGGSALMDAIKSRLAGAQEKSRLKKFRKEGSKELQDMFKKEAMSGDIPASGEYDPIGLQDIPLESEEDILRITEELDRNVDFNRAGSPRGRDANIDREVAIANQADFPMSINPIYQDFSGELSEELGEGDLFRISEAGAPAQDFSGELSEELGEGDLARLASLAAARAPIEYSNNEPPAVDPNDALTRIFQRTGSRAVPANSVDPMGLLGGESRDENVSEAQREEDAVNFLRMLNIDRVEKGLPEVNKITMDAIKETGRSTSELMNSRQFRQIPTNRPARQILNRYN